MASNGLQSAAAAPSPPLPAGDCATVPNVGVADEEARQDFDLDLGCDLTFIKSVDITNGKGDAIDRQEEDGVGQRA